MYPIVGQVLVAWIVRKTKWTENSTFFTDERINVTMGVAQKIFGRAPDEKFYKIGEVPLLITINSRMVASVARARSKVGMPCASHNSGFDIYQTFLVFAYFHEKTSFSLANLLFTLELID